MKDWVRTGRLQARQVIDVKARVVGLSDAMVSCNGSLEQEAEEPGAAGWWRMYVLF